MTTTAKPGTIQRLELDLCDFCGEARELRPYGPKGENICFECGMRNERETEKGFDRFHDGQAN